MRRRDLNTANCPFLRRYGLQNYFTDEVFLNRLAKSAKDRRVALERMEVFGNSLRWEDLGWLCSLNRLALLRRGVAAPAASNTPTTCNAPRTTA